jgi:hypothetical protein
MPEAMQTPTTSRRNLLTAAGPHMSARARPSGRPRRSGESAEEVLKRLTRSRILYDLAVLWDLDLEELAATLSLMRAGDRAAARRKGAKA